MQFQTYDGYVDRATAVLTETDEQLSQLSELPQGSELNANQIRLQTSQVSVKFYGRRTL